MREVLNQTQPLPASDKLGWPWAADFPEPKGVDGPFPKISVITISYNQECFLEETIRSVILQYYPNMEYFIIDGASTDKSVEIIKKYEKWITGWVSEKDSGISQAVNKGISMCSGEICSWVNSDDILLEGTLRKVAKAFIDNPASSVVYGDGQLTDCRSRRTGIWKAHYSNRNELIQYWKNWKEQGPCWLIQPATFFKRNAFNEVGGLDESLNLPSDYDLWIRFSEKYQFTYINKQLATYRFHERSRSSALPHSDWHRESIEVSKKYWGSITSLAYWKYLLSCTLHSCFYYFKTNIKALLKLNLTTAS